MGLPGYGRDNNYQKILFCSEDVKRKITLLTCLHFRPKIADSGLRPLIFLCFFVGVSDFFTLAKMSLSHGASLGNWLLRSELSK